MRSLSRSISASRSTIAATRAAISSSRVSLEPQHLAEKRDGACAPLDLCQPEGAIIPKGLRTKSLCQWRGAPR